MRNVLRVTITKTRPPDRQLSLRLLWTVFQTGTLFQKKKDLVSSQSICRFFSHPEIGILLVLKTMCVLRGVNFQFFHQLFNELLPILSHVICMNLKVGNEIIRSGLSWLACQIYLGKLLSCLVDATHFIGGVSCGNPIKAQLIKRWPNQDLFSKNKSHHFNKTNSGTMELVLAHEEPTESIYS